MSFIAFVRELRARRFPGDPYNWHPWTCIFPVRTIEGVTTSIVWRRWSGHHWEYRVRKPSSEKPPLH